ncbi:MAG: hypothetical protein ACOYL3_16035 [Desulfuromonadaceae bacterium]
MKTGMLLLCVFLLAGCSNVSQAELDAKIQKCTAADMEYTYMKDFRGKPYDVVCVRKHPNEK